MMPVQPFSQRHYPLDLHCSRKVWDATNLTSYFHHDQLPGRTFMRHLLADHLRTQSAQAITAAELELLATLNQILREVATDFLRRRGCRLTKNAMEIGDTILPMPGLEASLTSFLGFFPALPLQLEPVDPATYVEQLGDRGEWLELLLELVLLYVQSQNPALTGARSLFAEEEQQLRRISAYEKQLALLDQALPVLDDGYAAQPQTLLARLLEPLHKGKDLYSQVQLLRDVWSDMLPPELLARISTAIQQFEVEGHKPGFPGPPDTTPLDPATYMDHEYASFTADLAWMPRAVLLAKSTYVWLEQLSRRYQRPIYTLDQIPDEELDALVNYGFTSLWLIGIWKRSQASLKVKNLCGQQDVAASAYAIDDYVIDDKLGGEPAFEQLRNRCLQRGLDLACDVVTNHTGIESAWLREHPDWFVQLSSAPYPGYRFTGPDVSSSPDYSIQIEDGYYDHSEAAVVCRYQHRHTGEVRYIYHGNDGTHLPWNDTVQFNYLLPEMREAMIQLIIRVARRFRIIRFDAAMTLAKRHFQRLWYPLPGAAGGVPSRSDHALSQQDFNRYFPIEFWRELVDRVQLEAPDTLLVAEAFWLMEGYFVRTLGMHRVYNSAFMNMLMQEENAKYRQTIKNILVFDPAILQRFVNFMSNPDEEPAIEQFGDGDKYFCVATMLATMPGLPMFGHGQIEGLREKYGMEYLAPRWDEPVDKPLLERHRVSIFPLLRQRALFSGAEAFQLYDFESVYGVEEDVFVYSNQLEERRVLVICNNSSKSIVGRIGAPVAMAGRVGRDVATACAVDCSGDFVVMSDLMNNVQYLQPAASLRQGGDFSLKPYSSRVIAAFTAHQDKDERWQRLWQRHGDRAVRRLWLEHDGLLLEKSWPLLTELLALPQPQRARRQIRQLLIELESIYTAPPLAGMAKDYILEVQTHQRYPDLVLEHEGYGDLAWYLDRADTDDGWFRLFDRICNQHRLRPLLGCHYYDYYDWCVHQDLERFSLLLLGYQLFRERDRLAVEPVAMVDRTIEILRAIAKLQRQAAKVGYRVDQLLAQLDPRPPLDKPLAAQADGLKVLFVASEATPFAKSGGLADVAGSLPRALRLLGHDVQVVIPGYPQIDKAPVIPRKAPQSVEITLEGVPRRASLKQAVYDGVPYWFIDTPDLYQRDGLYSGPDGDYPDNGMRFGFFCRALLELARTLNFPPDVIHLHDWQTGLVPVLLKTSYAGDPFFAHTKTLLTVHNLGYHGTFPFSLLRQLELAGNLTSPAALEYYGNLSLLKGGIVFSDLVNTVSPTYCREIQTVEQGYGLDGLLRERSAHLHGILNGLDEQIWNPAQDSALPHNYSPRQLKNKQKCKALLQQELGLEVRADVPLVVVISRLDRQKGINLIESIWPQLLERPLQFALLGSGTPENMRFWQDRQGLSPGQVSINLTFNEGLSRRLYAAADMLLVPSLYEPCGLTQMIALKYGALPLVRRTGGLADTVVDVDDQPAGGNGFVFDHSDPWLLLATIDRALSHYHQPEAWAKLVKRGMMQDFSWAPSAQEYLKLYRYMIGLAADQEATGG